MLDIYSTLIRDISLIYPPAVHTLSGRIQSDPRMLAADTRGPCTITSMYVSAGIAVLNVSGVLIEHQHWSEYYGYVRSYDTLSGDLIRAVNDATVQAIVLYIDSPGGDVAGCFELCAEIIAARDVKPVFAVIDSMACSAAYAIASSANTIIMPPSGVVGSIGVVATHFDVSEMLKKDGVAVTHLFAGEHKVDGTPYASLSETAKASWMARIKKTYDVFCQHVSTARDLNISVIQKTQAGIYDADEAVSLGLADEVMGANQAFVAILTAMGRAE